MSKGYLVLDYVPVYCMVCPCITSSYGIRCAITGDVLKDRLSKPSNCPIKEMPDRKPELEMDIVHHESVDCGYYLGWNALLDKLEGVERNE